MINSNINNGGIYRAYIIGDSSDIRIYIPGLYNNTESCPINVENNSLDMELFNKLKETYPKPLWCIPNIEAKQHEQVHPSWVVFENGDITKPIVMGFLGKGIKYSAGIGVSSPFTSGSGSSGSIGENARRIYYLYDALGVPKVNISGILGNYTVENSIDPTTVETIYNEPYSIGPKKQAAQSDWDSFTRNTVFTMYDNQGTSISKSAYKASDGKYYPGIAMNSATGEAARQLLEYANKMDMNWFSLELQLMFNLGLGGTKGVIQYEFMTKTWKKGEASPSEAAIIFGQKYEHSGISPTGTGILNSQKREAEATSWYNKMINWEPNLAYGYALIKKAGYEAPTQASNFNKEIWDSANDDDLILSSIKIGDIIAYFEYLETSEGKKAKEHGPGTGTQCVELPNDYVEVVFGHKNSGGFGHGKDYYNGVATLYPNTFEAIKWSNGEMLQYGDIVSMSSPRQPAYGHVVIIKSVSGNSIQVLDQYNGSGNVLDRTWTLSGDNLIEPNGTVRELIGIARPK